MSHLSVHPASPHRVLVIGDGAKTRALIVEALEREGWSVTGACCDHETIGLLDRHGFDLVVLDCTGPKGDSFALLRHVRSRGAQLPVLLLSGSAAVGERIVGLDSGADDCLGKPFAMAELVARSRALLRRPYMDTTEFLQCADLHLDPRARVVTRAGQEIPLSPREVELLEYLFRYRGQAVTREMLERDVWKQTHRLTSLDNVIDVQMNRLRRKIDGAGRIKLIHTLRGVGYRLSCPRSAGAA